MDGDLRQSDGWAKYLRRLGWAVAEARGKKRGAKVYVRNIPILGSVVKIQRPAEIPPVREIDRIARERRALLVKLEPLTSASPAGFEPDPNPNLPTRTITIDLSRTEEELWKNLSKDARQSIRKAQGNRLRTRGYRFGEEGFDRAVERFHSLLKETGKRQGFWTGDYAQLRAKTDAFGKDAVVFLVSYDGRMLAGALILLAGKTAYYHHTASGKAGQALFAPYLLMWEIFRFLKKETAARRLEFEGTADPRFPQTKHWEGFTVFKRKWGGEETDFPPPLIKYYSPLVRILFSLARRTSVV